MLKKFNEFVNERQSIPDKDEFLKWVIGFKEKYDHLEDWNWLLDSITNDENSDDEELKEYFLSEKKDPDTTENMIDELIEHRTGFMIYMVMCLASEYDVSEVELFEPGQGKNPHPHQDTREDYPDMVESKKDIKATKIKCHVCGKKFDPQKYQQHHKNCVYPPDKK